MLSSHFQRCFGIIPQSECSEISLSYSLFWRDAGQFDAYLYVQSVQKYTEQDHQVSECKSYCKQHTCDSDMLSYSGSGMAGGGPILLTADFPHLDRVFDIVDIIEPRLGD